MKRKYSICIVSALLLFGAAFSSMQNYEPEENVVEEPSIITQGEAAKEEIYFLTELNGYVAVYKEDKKTIFEYTNINVDELPDVLAEEIRCWKKIEGKPELYGFLENFSS